MQYFPLVSVNVVLCCSGADCGGNKICSKTMMTTSPFLLIPSLDLPRCEQETNNISPCPRPSLRPYPALHTRTHAHTAAYSVGVPRQRKPRRNPNATTPPTRPKAAASKATAPPTRPRARSLALQATAAPGGAASEPAR